MNYRDIVAVTGLPGLYQLLANKGDGAIVRELSGGASKFLPARLHRVTPLETIEVYTTGSNVRLQKVFEAMQAAEDKETMPDAKADSATLRNYFDTVFPDYDGSRVYDSDLKKMVRWYGILKGADLLKFEEETEEASTEEGTAGDEQSAPETSTEKSSAKSKSKSAGSSSEDALASTTDMPAEGAAQLAEEKKADQTELAGLEGEAAETKKPRAKKAAKSETSGEDGGEAPAKKSRSKKAAAPSEGGEEAAPKKVARKKKDSGE